MGLERGIAEMGPLLGMRLSTRSFFVIPSLQMVSWPARYEKGGSLMLGARSSYTSGKDPETPNSDYIKREPSFTSSNT